MNGIDDYSLSAIAKILGRAKSGLHKLSQRGQIPKQTNGRYNLRAVQEALKANIEPSRAKRVRAPGEHPKGERVNTRVNKRAAKPVKTPEEAAEAISLIRGILEAEGAAAGVIDFQAARTAELILKTRERALRMDVESGRLCDVQTLHDCVFKFARTQRDMIQNWPSQVGAIIAGELGLADIPMTIITLEKYIRQLLIDIAESPKFELTKGRGKR